MFPALRTLSAPPPGPGSARLDDAAFVLSLRAHGVFSIDVLRAMETVRREHFAPRRFADLARADIALPLAFGRTMTAPSIVAAMVVALDVRPGHRVLEVGTGSGYVTALLARLGATVHSRERHPAVADSARNRLEAAGFASFVDLIHADGFAAPEPGEPPYDRILLNGVVPALPAAFTSRLGAGGRIVAATREGGRVRLLTIGRDGSGRLTRALGQTLRIAPLDVAPSAETAATATES